MTANCLGGPRRRDALRRTLPQATRLAAVLVAAIAAGLPRGTAAAERDTAAARAARIGQMSPEDKQALAHKLERFAALAPDERDRLRQLDADLNRDARAAELRETMTRYYEWLRGLTPGQRAELMELPADQRLERIRQIKAEQDRRPRGLLPTEDRKRLFDWLQEFAWEHQRELLEPLPTGWRTRILQLNEAQRRQALVWTAWQRWRFAAPDDPRAALTVERLSDVLPRLSAATRGRLSDLKTPEEAHELLLAWVREALAFSRDQPNRQLPQVSPEELERFFKNDLQPWQREHLMGLPRDQMQRELKWLYFQSASGRAAGDGRPPRPPGPEFGPPPGPDGAPPPGRGPRIRRRGPDNSPSD